MTDPLQAVFLSYASQDMQAALHMADALRAAGIETWFDQNELRGGDVWDRRIRDQIRRCALFIPLISRQSQARLEGYFRREWKLAADRTQDMADERPFLLPVVIDDTRAPQAHVPDKFREVQWSYLPGGVVSPAFVKHVAALLSAKPAELALSPIAAPGASISSPPPTRARPAWRWVVCLAVGAIAIAAVLEWNRARTPFVAPATPPATPVTEKSIAVLPFADLSPGKDQAFFAEGISEELLELLAQTPGLRVIGRTSSFQFRGKDEDLRVIGSALGATYLIEGTLQKLAEHLRVTARLVDATTGVQAWAQTYDRNVGDLLTLQDELATGIARALQLTIAAPAPRPFADAREAQAYALFLKGQLAQDSFNADSLTAATDAFQQALELDPTSLPALDGLAAAWTARGLENDGVPLDAWGHAQDAATRVLAVNPNDASAIAVEGAVAVFRDFDWARGQDQIERALHLRPSDPSTMELLTEVLLGRGRLDDALHRAHATVALDPLSADAQQILGQTHYLRDEAEPAEQSLRGSLRLRPEIGFSHYLLGVILLRTHRVSDAAREFAASASPVERDVGLVLLNHTLNKTKEADAAAHRLDGPESASWPYGVAVACAYRGQTEKAFHWLDQAFSVRDSSLVQLAPADPLLFSLHRDPRWNQLLQHMQLSPSHTHAHTAALTR